MKKTKVLKKLLQSKELSFLMEAHNGLSAKIVEEAGHQGIWGSGLSISASLGVRDNNEASWTQVLETVEFMSDATKIPILLDGDTGYGNFNNMRRLVQKLEQRNVAGVCIEDKIFPKTNSFLREERQPLADIDEFCGKIKAGLDARSDDDFCIVARVEAFIAGWGLEEALRRAEAYRSAGATAILIHSKKSTVKDIDDFMKEWGNRAPIVIVPTKYYSTPTETFRSMGISTVIWANQILRSATKAMQKTAKQIYCDQSIINIEDDIVSVKEIFRLQNDHELEEAENKYLKKKEETKAIILAASRGVELMELTQNRPKSLLSVNGTPLLQITVNKLKNVGISDINVVRGYKKDTFPELGCHYYDNDEYATTGELYSLEKAVDKIEDNIIIAYGDIAFKNYIINSLMLSEDDISIVVDSSIIEREDDYIGDYVFCDRPNKKNIFDGHSYLTKAMLSEKNNCGRTPDGEWIGILKASAQGSLQIKHALNELKKTSQFEKLKMGDLLNYLLDHEVKIGVVYIEGHWMDIDHYQNYEEIQVF